MRAGLVSLAQIPERVAQVVVRLCALRPRGDSHEEFGFGRFKLALFIVGDPGLVVCNRRGGLATVRRQGWPERRRRIQQGAARHGDEQGEAD